MIGNYILEIPNNAMGKLFLRLFRKYLNRKTYNIRVRGRHRNRKGLERRGIRLNFDRDVPLEHAERLVIYIWKKEVKEDGLVYGRNSA